MATGCGSLGTTKMDYIYITYYKQHEWNFKTVQSSLPP